MLIIHLKFQTEMQRSTLETEWMQIFGQEKPRSTARDPHFIDSFVVVHVPTQSIKQSFLSISVRFAFNIQKRVCLKGSNGKTSKGECLRDEQS
jgi:hypothetical protein